MGEEVKGKAKGGRRGGKRRGKAKGGRRGGKRRKKKRKMTIMTKILTNNDFPIMGQLGFQDPATPVMETIVNFHNYTMLYLVFVITAVL